MMKKYKYSITLTTFLTLIVGLQFILAPKVFAVEPGCYEDRGNDGLYLKVNCTDEGAARAVSQFGACFVTSGSRYSERDCANLNRSGIAVPGATSREISQYCESKFPSGNADYESCLRQNDYQAVRARELAAQESENSGNDDAEEPVVEEGSLEPIESDVDCEVADGNLTRENCGIIDYLVIAINVLTGLAGMAIVASIIIAGYQYMTARDNAGQIQKAKSRIVWALTALGLMIFMYAILNYLVPGGVF